MKFLSCPHLRRIKRANQQGQVVIEYVLLILITVGIATLIMRTMVSRNQDEPGFLLAKWQSLLVEIGKDDPNQRSP